MENTLQKLLRESKNFAQSASNSVASNVSAPVDGLAWLLRKAGVPMPANPMGGSDWMAEKGLTRPANQNSLSGLMGEFAGMAGPMVAAGKAPQIAGGLLGMADNLAAPRQLSTQAGVFIGPGAKTWNAGEAARANAMTDAGTDARKVWSETGTWKGPDGHWRQEIPDNMAALRTPTDMTALAQSYKARQLEIKDLIAQSKLHPDLFPKDLTTAQKTMRAESASYKAPLTEYFGLNHPEAAKAKYAYDHTPLNQAYPEMMENVVIRQGGDDGSFFGSYVNNQLDVNRSASLQPGGANSTTAHEIQHAIQGREGWSGGGNQGQFQAISSHSPELTSLKDNLAELHKLPWTPEVGKQFQSVNQQIKELMDNPFQSYRRLAGEAEARATQARIPLNAAQRRATFPLDSYDVPLNQLIIRK